MYKIETSNKFLKDLKLLKKRSRKDFDLLEAFIEKLAEKGHKGLDKKHVPHKLSGKYQAYWECHVKQDLLLIWSEDDGLKLIELIRTGSHSDLFSVGSPNREAGTIVLAYLRGSYPPGRISRTKSTHIQDLYPFNAFCFNAHYSILATQTATSAS